MTTQTILNLPTQDVSRAKSFYSSLGFRFNEKLSDEHALCFNITDSLLIALLPTAHFAEATQGEVADTTTAHEVLISLGQAGEADVDSLVTAAIAAGARELHEPVHVGDIYGRSFADLDSHQWNIFYKAS